MTASIPSIALFAIFEVCIFFTSIRLTYLIINKFETSIIQLVTVWIICDIVISSTIAEFFSFIHFNDSFQYLLSSIILVFVLHAIKKSNLSRYWTFLTSTFGKLLENILNWKIIVSFSFILPILLWIIRPIDETDSLFVLNYMFDWLSNNTTPYVMQANYVAFWELTYLPSMVITHTDNFFWLASFKSIIVAGLSTYLVGRQIGLSPRLCWMTALTGVLFVGLWINPSGIGTLKNDLIFACGIILITLSIMNVIRGSVNRLTAIFFTMGISFVLVKYQGLGIAFLAILLLIMFSKREFLKSKKTLMGILVFIIVVLVTSGHYYIYHVLQYGNPVYPFSFTLLGHSLNGQVSYPNTSIISSAGDDQLYQYLLFTPSNITKAGFIFPILLIFGVIGTLVIVSQQVINFLKKRNYEKQIMFLSLFIFITWVVFFFTPLSAHAIPGDYVYIKGLSTLRYAEGTLILTEVFFIYILWKLRFPQYVLLALVGIDLISRMLYLYSLLPTYLNYSIMIYPIAALITLMLFQRYLKTTWSKIIVVLILGTCVFVFTPQIVEANRNGWAWWWNDVIMKTQDLPASSHVYLITKDPINADEYSWPVKYPVLGNKFQNSVNL